MLFVRLHKWNLWGGKAAVRRHVVEMDVEAEGTVGILPNQDSGKGGEW